VRIKRREWLWFRLLQRYHKYGDEFLNHIVRVTCEETWISFVNFENKEQSKQWMQNTFTKKAEKFKETLSARKLMATVFWDRTGHQYDGGLHATRDHSNVRSVLQNTKKLRRAIQNKRRGMLTPGVVHLHHNTRPHSVARTRALL
jgi:hypothetical protein